MHDVIIAGAGPIGSYIAGRLAAMGHRVLVLEKRPRVGGSLCTGIVGLECAKAFGIDDGVIVRKVNSARLFSPGGIELRAQREETQACILDRTALDTGIAEQARRAGAEFEFSSTVMNVSASGNNAIVRVSRSGKEDSIPARAAVIAAGFSPGLIGRLGFGVYRYYTVGAQTETEVRDIDEVEVYFGDVAPDFFGWIIPTTEKTARIGLLSRGKPGHYLKKWLSRLAAQGRISSPDVEIRYGAIPLHPLSRTTGERVMLVGDTAGQVKPITGGGIYYGLICADIAVATLQQALADDDLSAARLSQYHRDWYKKLGRELRRGYQVRKLYELLSNRQVDFLFRIAKSCGIEESLRKAENVYFDWHGRTLFSLLKYRLVTGPWNAIRHPSRSGRLTGHPDER